MFLRRAPKLISPSFIPLVTGRKTAKPVLSSRPQSTGLGEGSLSLRERKLCKRSLSLWERVIYRGSLSLQKRGLSLSRREGEIKAGS
jgi:hypothetical protein